MGTWNVRSLYAAGKFENLIQEIKCMSLSVTGISELRWPGLGTCNHDDSTLYYSGSDEEDKDHRYGVGIFVPLNL